MLKIAIEKLDELFKAVAESRHFTFRQTVQTVLLNIRSTKTA